MRLWEAIWDVIDTDAVQPSDDKSGQSKSYNIDKAAVKSALDKREGRIVQANDFRQRVNLLNRAFDAGDVGQTFPLNLKVTITKPGRLRMIWNVDAEKSLSRVVEGNLDIITENYTESSVYDPYPVKPLKIFISHAHEDEEAEKIKDAFVSKLRLSFKNSPNPNDKWEIIYDKDDVKGTKTFDKFMEDNGGTAKYAIFLTSNKWRKSEPCQKELAYFWDGNEHRPGRISLFLEFSNQWQKMGGIVNWIEWKFDYRNLLSFWEKGTQDDKNQLIESIRDQFLSLAVSLKSGTAESVTRQKRIEENIKFTPGESPDSTIIDQAHQKELSEKNTKAMGADTSNKHLKKLDKNPLSDSNARYRILFQYLMNKLIESERAIPKKLKNLSIDINVNFRLRSISSGTKKHWASKLLFGVAFALASYYISQL